MSDRLLPRISEFSRPSQTSAISVPYSALADRARIQNSKWPPQTQNTRDKGRLIFYSYSKRMWGLPVRTLKLKAQPINAFFATINHMFGGSFQLPNTAERAVITSLSTVQTKKQCLAVVGSWEEPPNIWLTVAKNAFVGWALSPHVIERRGNDIGI